MKRLCAVVSEPDAIDGAAIRFPAGTPSGAKDI